VFGRCKSAESNIQCLVNTELQNRIELREQGENDEMKPTDLPTTQLPSPSREVDLTGLGNFAALITKMTNDLRDQILAPRPRKTPPVFTSAEVSEFCGIERTKMNYLWSKKDNGLPEGAAHGTGRSRIFTLAETRQWVQRASTIPQSPLVTGEGSQRGKVIITANFKGGSAKTTTTMCLAQALTLRGRRVLVIDLDPQASLSELCGLYAEKDVAEEDTVMQYIYEPNMEGGLGALVQSTYWDGLDVVPAHNVLHSAEYYLPAMQTRVEGFRFWSVLRDGLEPLREHYDYIILDTAPSLSYLTLNGLMAADAMVMPLVPESLDFISSASFWALFTDVVKQFAHFEPNKKYEFISVLLSKVDYGAQASAPIVRGWAQRAYNDWLSTIEIPASSIMSNGATALSTVFDLSKSDSAAKSLLRVRQPLIEYTKWLDEQFLSNQKKNSEVKNGHSA
jgi:chromosome partitioning protein